MGRMIVEHDFVTTVPSATAMDRVDAFLRTRGFSTTLGERSLRARGGRRAPHPGRPLTEWPIVVAVEEDRGRVTVAADLDTRYGEPEATSIYLQALASRIEAAVADASGAASSPEWQAALGAVEEEFRWRRRRRRILWAVLLGAIGLLFGLILWVVVSVGSR
jgi:hypothetical protein